MIYYTRGEIEEKKKIKNSNETYVFTRIQGNRTRKRVIILADKRNETKKKKKCCLLYEEYTRIRTMSFLI